MERLGRANLGIDVDSPSVVSHPLVDNEVDEAGRRAELAVAEARASGTPEAWRQAIGVVVAVADVIQVTTAMHDAVRAAREAKRAVQVAAEAAQAAHQRADDARNTAQAMEKAVARAREVDTPDGWSEAAQIALGLGVTTEAGNPLLSDVQPPPPNVELRVDAANGAAPPPPPPPPTTLHRETASAAGYWSGHRRQPGTRR
jgi:hypothetical protein